MSKFWIKSFLLTTLLLSGIFSLAQVNRFENEWNLPGELIKYTPSSKYFQNLKGISVTKQASLKRTINLVLTELYKMQQLNPPMGFNANPFMIVPRWVDQQKSEPLAKLLYYFRVLTKDNRTGQVKRSMDGTDFHLDINGLYNLFDRVGNFWEDCDELHLPNFFEEVPITDSTADYLEINFKYYGYPYVSNNVKNTSIRIVLANHTPPLIPLSRKEFLQFLIAKKESEIKEEQKRAKELPTQIAESKKVLSGLLSDPSLKNDPSLKKQIDQTIKANEDAVAQEQQRLKHLQEKLERCRQTMKAMSPQEAAAPARLDSSKQGEEFVNLEQLVPVGRKEGVLLERINPKYYDKSINAPAAQSITLYYTWPEVGFTQNPDPLQQTTIDIFNHLDYHRLKESMQ